VRANLSGSEGFFVGRKRIVSQIVGWPNWIGVVAEDLERQRAFYGDVMGFRELDRGEFFVQFDLGWPTMLEVIRLDTTQPQYPNRGFQIGLSTGDIDATYSLLSQRGVEVVTKLLGGTEHGGSWAYFRDVEGNLFEICQTLGPPWVRDTGGPSRAVVGAPVWAGIIARDLAKTAAWVEETFGFRSFVHTDRWAWFDLGWPNLFEVIRHDVHSRQYAQPGWQVAFAAGDIAAAREVLIARGARPLHDTEGGPEYAGYWCHFLDAEDNVFAITQRLGPPWPAEER
jgi:predicted enzyme related to lactoylglutathione lyase